MLSSDDPVRVFQRYSTLNAISGSGRGHPRRGSSIDSFPLFGYDLADYEELFEEKLNLFAELLKGGPVTWQGNTRAALTTRMSCRTPKPGRSQRGSAWAAARSRSSAPRATVSR